MTQYEMFYVCSESVGFDNNTLTPGAALRLNLLQKETEAWRQFQFSFKP